MTVALVLAGEADAGLCTRLAALGVRRVDAADQTGPGLLTVAAAARAAGERLLICMGEDTVPEPILARLLEAGGTAAFTGVPQPASARPAIRADGTRGGGALVVDPPDLAALATAAEALAAAQAALPAAGALVEELAARGVPVRVLDDGPDSTGALVRLIDPAARDVARWAGARELTPAALYGIALGFGLIAAVWFSELAVRAKVLAIVVLGLSFLTCRAASVLTAASRDGRVRPVVAWLGGAAGLVTELAVYAGLAVSAGLPGAPGVQVGTATVAGLDGPLGSVLRDTTLATWAGAGTAGVWRLAIAAALVLGVRRLAGLGYECTAWVPGNLFARRSLRTLEQAVMFPAAERYAVIAVTALFFGPRLTFLLLLAWGVLAAGYVLAGRFRRADEMARPERIAEAGRPQRINQAQPSAYASLADYRDDGELSRWLGRLARGVLPPLPPLLVGLFVTCVLTALGLGNLPAGLLLVPPEAMLLAALGARHPHDGRGDWLAPALLLTGEGVYLAALGLSHRVAPALVFALLAAVIMRHVDVAYRARAGLGLPADRFGLGWEGRMLLAGLAAAFGVAPLAYAVISGYLWLLFGWDFLSGWLTAHDDG